MRSKPCLWLALALLWPLCVWAQDPAEDPDADPEPTKLKVSGQTPQKPDIDTRVLALKLRPMTKAELAEEVKGWMSLVKAKVTELSEVEIIALRSDAGRGAALTKIATLREQRSALVDRARIVLLEFKEKGGDNAESMKYLKAATGFKLDAKDVFDWHAVSALGWSWLKSKEGGIKWGVRLLSFVLTLLIFRFVAWLLGRATRRIVNATKNSSELLRDFLVTMVGKITMLIGFIVGLSFFQINTGPFVALIGGLGFVAAFAFQGTLSNFAAGVLILLYRPYDVGDVVEVKGQIGTVDSMNLVSTTILTGDNQEVIVPNSAIWGNIIKNVTGRDTRRVDLVIGVGYGDDLAQAQRVLEEVAAAHPLVLKDPAPNVKVHELGDSSVNFVVRPWCRTPDYWRVRWDLMREVKQALDREGISIPFPQRDVHLHQSETASVEAPPVSPQEAQQSGDSPEA